MSAKVRSEIVYSFKCKTAKVLLQVYFLILAYPSEIWEIRYLISL